MEKVECMKCGSIGYTASPEQVPCSDCGGKHKVISQYPKISKRKRILLLFNIRKG